MNNSYITIIKEKRTVLSRKRVPLNQNECTADFRIGVPFEQNLHRNYRKELKRRRNKEISYCELPEIVVEKLAVWDEYESDYTAFDVCGIEVRVLDDDLAEAIKYLSEKDREILLMYFFLGMSDTEIGDRLKINRSTSFRSRKNSLEELKKKLKENMNDE